MIAALAAATLGLTLLSAPASAGSGDDRRLGEPAVSGEQDSPLQQWIDDRLEPTTQEQAVSRVSARYSTYLCTGYSGCRQAGYSNAGYRSHSGTMYWNMYSGHNCTNYAAYRMVRAGMPNRRPWGSGGNATYWGVRKSGITDRKPMVGAIAWWKAYAPGAGSNGHVAYVERVVSRRTIIISEDSWSGDFHWRRIRKGEGSWPSGFIHFKDQRVKALRGPTLSEDPRVGEVLRLDRGTWPDGATTSVRWLANGKVLGQVTGNSLRLTPGLLRSRIEVHVRAERSGYRDGLASVVSARVRRGSFELREAPSITGARRVGHVLRADPGRWSPAPETTSYQWFAGGDPIAGATSARLRLSPELLKRRISLQTRVRADGYQGAVAESDRTDRIKRGRIHLRSAFGLGGRLLAGERLEVLPGEVTPGAATATYQWLRGDHAVKGATSRHYTTSGRDLGHTMSVRVTLRSDGYSARSFTLTRDRVVRTRPTLSWDAIGRDHKAVVKVSLAALGVDHVRGPVTVRVGRTSVTSRLHEGALRVVLRHLDPGTHRVTVTYPGRGELVLPVSATGTVRVRRH